MPRFHPEYYDYGMWNPMFHWDGRKAVFQHERNAWEFIEWCEVPIEVPVRVTPKAMVI